MSLAFAMESQKGLEIGLRYSHDRVYAMYDEIAGIDPSAHRRLDTLRLSATSAIVKKWMCPCR